MNRPVVMTNVRIVDGSGAPWFRGEVLLRGSTIEAVGASVPRLPESHLIDAQGLTLTPGFIDIHHHGDFGVLNHPEGANALLQGVTTIVIGQCGLSPAPICDERVAQLDSYCGVSATGQHVNWTWRSFDDWLSTLEQLPLALNVGAFVGQGTIRLCVMGFDDRPPTMEELNRMRDLAAQAMNAGAFGMTSGLAYPPGIYSSDEELEYVAGGLSATSGLYLSHMRNQSTLSPQCVEATINVGRVNSIPVQVVHLKAREQDSPGMSTHLFTIIEKARSEGVDITIDQYPYTAASSNMRSLMPQWVHTGGVEGIVKLLSVPESRAKVHDDMEQSSRWLNTMKLCRGPSGIVLGTLPHTPQYSGMNLQAICQAMETDAINALLEIVKCNKGADHGVYFTMTEQDVQNVMPHRLVMIGSDGTIVEPGTFHHPRSCGTFVRILGHYVREIGLLSLEEAVRKMTSFPAARLGLSRKGLIRPGMDADLVLFDETTVAEGNSYESPLEPPRGIKAVWVAGQLTVQNGALTENRYGRLLRKGQNC